MRVQGAIPSVKISREQKRKVGGVSRPELWGIRWLPPDLLYISEFLLYCAYGSQLNNTSGEKTLSTQSAPPQEQDCRWCHFSLPAHLCSARSHESKEVSVFFYKTETGELVELLKKL